MKPLLYLAAFQLFMLITLSTFSNNILVENVSLEDQVAAEHYVFIEFDLSWDNSWRTISVPNNWDAAWVFCKFKVAGGVWQHIYLHYAGHTAPAGAAIDVASDSTGAFIYRDANGNGQNDWDNIRLRWDYGHSFVNDDAALEVKVFAVEMVYIAQGSFYLGDSTSFYHFHSGSDNKSFYQVTSEDSIIAYPTNGNLWAISIFSEGTISSAYPKGYKAFYIMKYELSQEQYVEFLNTLTRTQQNTRTATDISGTTVTNIFVMSNNTTVIQRNGIRCDATLPVSGPVEFYMDYNNNGTRNETGDGQNIASNFISWVDLAAYLDWSGLRPMTELEFEKACRGPNNPVGDEYAWGNNLIYEGVEYILANPGQPNESINSLPQNVGNASWFNTNGQVMRCGVFAASSVNHTRMETGATYYGIMEMSGNLWEISVDAYDQAGRSFTGLHGNGILLASGDADVDYWPGINGNYSETTANTAYQTAGVTGDGGTGPRGGMRNSQLNQLSVSSRILIYEYDLTVRNESGGGRGCRTAL